MIPRPNVRKRWDPVCCRWTRSPSCQVCTRSWRKEVRPLKGSHIWVSNRVSSHVLPSASTQNSNNSTDTHPFSPTVNLWMIYKAVEKMGGYDSVSNFFIQTTHDTDANSNGRSQVEYSGCVTGAPAQTIELWTRKWMAGARTPSQKYSFTLVTATYILYLLYSKI